MASTTIAQTFQLGHLVSARGKFGPAHFHATQAQMCAADAIVTATDSYTTHLEETVCCVDDRLDLRAPRLAGGGLCLGLMRNLLFGSHSLSADLRELRAFGFTVVLHDECGALKLAPTLIPARLSNPDADGYKLLDRLGVQASPAVRRRIATWATNFSGGYIDKEAALRAASRKDPVVGPHNAVCGAVSMEEGVSFGAAQQFRVQTGGLLPFAFDPWVAPRDARRIAVSQDDAIAAAMMALVFSAEVFLELCDQDLVLAVHR